MAVTKEGLRKAGSKLGIDLAGLFEDENGEATGFEGLFPSFKITSQLKGRSPSTATFKAAAEPARTVEFELAPEIASAVSAPPAAAPAPAPEPEQALKTYFGTVGGVGVEDIGEKGFGLKDYYAAIDAGYDPESIKSWVQSQRPNLYNIGPGAQEVLGIQGYESTTPGLFDYTKYGAGGFGMKDVKALRAKGVDENTIRTLAAQAPMVGPKAAAQLNVAPSRTQTITSTYDPGSAGGAGFGMKDVEALRAQGVSDAQMREIAKRSSMIGGGAAAYLGI